MVRLWGWAAPMRSRRWAAVAVAACVWLGAPLAGALAQGPQRPAAVARPSVEERQSFDKRMMAIHPARQGCFTAHYPVEQWVETKCLPPPKLPNPVARGAHPNTVGDGTDWFATVTSGHISEATGSFDSVSGVVALDGPKGGVTSTVFPNTYSLQMNANQFATTVGGCDKDTNCAGWEQFIFSQSQCGSAPCAFIEY